MKVILEQYVRGQGKRGQLIDVSDGYARNFLLPRKLAKEASADNINTMRMNDIATQERQAKERAEALAAAAKMREMTVVVTAKGGGAGRLFGSVTNNEVAEALAASSASCWTSARSSSTDRNVGRYTSSASWLRNHGRADHRGAPKSDPSPEKKGEPLRMDELNPASCPLLEAEQACSAPC